LIFYYFFIVFLPGMNGAIRRASRSLVSLTS
jgi:hypothetical protein